jgi:protein TonB
MFNDVVNPSIKIGSKKWYTVPLSIALHVIVIGLFVIVPLMAADILPTPPAMMAFISTPPAPPPPPPPPPPATAAAPKVEMNVNPNAAPVEAPKQIGAETGLARDPETGLSRGVEGGIQNGVDGGIVGGLPDVPPPPPPAPLAPVRVGGDIKAPVKTRNAAAIYPAIAQQARVQGIVIIDAIIGTNGKVTDARVTRSIPLLDQAALDAVRQWEYTPTLLNGVPVPVIMTVIVTFTLQ